MTAERQTLGEAKRECKSLACAIQTCLKRKSFDEKRCVKEIEAWRQCDLRLKQLEQLMQDGQKILAERDGDSSRDEDQGVNRG